MNTTKASAGTIVTHDKWNWNVLGPLDVIFTDENKKLMGAGRRLQRVFEPIDGIAAEVVAQERQV